MFTLSGFSQSTFLRHEADPNVRLGVCAGCCQIWLSLFEMLPNESSEMRIHQLGARFSSVVAQHKSYQKLKTGRDLGEARRLATANVGVRLEDQTTIFKNYVGFSGVTRRIINDLGIPGRGAYWTLTFETGERHAWAGYCGIRRLPHGIQMRLHVFDPNVGEYEGEMADAEDIFRDLFNRNTLYRRVMSMERNST